MIRAFKLLVAACALFIAGSVIYDMVRPVEVISYTYTVKAGDTWYAICDDTYITKNNSECFNAYWDRHMSQKKKLYPGDVIVITNKIFK